MYTMREQNVDAKGMPLIQMAHLYGSMYFRRGLGFALFLAWSYYSLFSCGLLPAPFVFNNIEPIWIWSGIFMVLTAGVIGVLSHWFDLSRNRVLIACAALTGAVGSLLIWMGYLDPAAHHGVSVAGGAFAGIGMACMTYLWGTRLSALDEGAIAFWVPVSFLFSIVVYFAMIVAKGTPAMIVDVMLPFASVLFILARPEAMDDEKLSAPLTLSLPLLPAARRSDALFGLGTLFSIGLILWSQFAYFRILSAPEVVDGNFMRSLVPFLCLLLISAAALVFCVKLSRCLNFLSMLRWGLPIILLSYVVLYIDFENSAYKTLAYTINFIGMNGVLMGFWVVAPKYIKRTHIPQPLMYGVLIAAWGAGFFTGTSFALGVVDAISGAQAILVSLVFFMAALVVTMMVAFNPRWLLFNSEFRWDEEESDDEPMPMQKVDQDLSALFAQKAEGLRHTYGLSRRETEVATLLLAGRNRPYISEELTITLNTVNAHTRSIYTKCGVHSQQELMDLASSND